MSYNGAKNKVRINLTIDKELKARAESIAKEENRSFNNLLVTVLQKYISDIESRRS